MTMPSVTRICLKLSTDVVSWTFKNGSMVCLNFSAYELCGVSQIRLKTGPTICDCTEKY